MGIILPVWVLGIFFNALIKDGGEYFDGVGDLCRCSDKEEIAGVGVDFEVDCVVSVSLWGDGDLEQLTQL